MQRARVPNDVNILDLRRRWRCGEWHGVSVRVDHGNSVDQGRADSVVVAGFHAKEPPALVAVTNI